MSLFGLFDGWSELSNPNQQIRGEEAHSEEFPEPGETVLLTVQNEYMSGEVGERRVVTSSLKSASVGSTYRWTRLNNTARVLAWKPTSKPYVD